MSTSPAPPPKGSLVLHKQMRYYSCTVALLMHQQYGCAITILLLNNVYTTKGEQRYPPSGLPSF